MISERLRLHDHAIREVFLQVHPENPVEIPLGKLRELWASIAKLTRTVMVKAGTEYIRGQSAKLADDPDCVFKLQEHVCLAHFIAERGTGRFNT